MVRAPRRAPRLLTLAGALAGARAACEISDLATVVVYADTAGGVGPNSASWTRQFFDWFAAANAAGAPPLRVSYVTRAASLAAPGPGACAALTAFPRLVLYVQPGGATDEQVVALGPGGRDNILDFAASPAGHVMGTCAGFYFFAGSYFWKGGFYARAWAPHFLPTVEGDIAAIATYPAYAPTTLDDGRTVLYWGGPTWGLNATAANAVPPGAETLSTFADAAVPGRPPAAVSYVGEFSRGLYISPHPEAVAGDGIECAPPLPSGCITPAQQLENWRWLAAAVNKLTGQSWVVPTTL